MEGGVSPAKSILEKPLKLLTEEDISQLTREDCRKVLKEKGMRKPSWNKSQAIQQVLSLKALLEPGAGILHKILVSHPPNPNHVKATSIEHRSDSPRSAEFSGSSGHYLPEKNSLKTLSPSRSPAETSALVGQMTIFYSGKVKVYDGVTPEKTRTTMQLAANPTDLPENSVFASNSMVSSPMCKEKMVEHPYKRNASRDSDVEGQGNRKVSLHRYREKRKDRFSKAKKTPGAASSGLEMFLNRCQPQMNAAPPENQTKSSNLFS